MRSPGLLGLLDAPEDIPVLFPLVSREIVLRLLQTPQAPGSQRRSTAAGPRSWRVRRRC